MTIHRMPEPKRHFAFALFLFLVLAVAGFEIWGLPMFSRHAHAQSGPVSVTTDLPFTQIWSGTQNIYIQDSAAPSGASIIWVAYVDGVCTVNPDCIFSRSPAHIALNTTQLLNGQHTFYVNVVDANTGAEYGSYGPVNFTTNNGEMPMQLRANYNELWLTPGQSVQLQPKMVYTDNTSAPLAASSILFTSASSGVATIDGNGNVFAAGLGDTSISLSYGSFSDTVLVHVNAQNNTPHFGNDGSQLTSYVPGKSMFVRSMFTSLDSNLPQYVSAFHAAQVNTLESGFFAALDNYGSSSAAMASWQSSFNSGVTSIQSAINDGFNILLTGDGIARGEQAIYNVTRGPSTAWSTSPLAYAFNWAKSVGKIIGVEMVDEIGFGYSVPFPQGQLGQSGGPQSISCTNNVCTVNWPAPYLIVNGAHTFLITGATSNANLNRPVTNLYTISSFNQDPNNPEGYLGFVFNATGVGTQTFTPATDPNLSIQIFASAPDGPNGTDYVHNDAFQDIMSEINSVPGRPSITWPDPASAAPANFAAWGADPRASDYADIYVADLLPAYPDSVSLYSQLYAMNAQWNAKYPVVQKNKPTFMIYGLVGPGYGIQGTPDPVVSINNDTVVFANPHGITSSNLDIGVTRFSITGNSDSALNGNYYVYQVVDPYTVKVYKEIPTTDQQVWAPTITFADGTVLNMTGNDYGNMYNTTYGADLGFAGGCYNLPLGDAGMAATVSSTDASFNGQWYVDAGQGGSCDWAIKMNQLPSGSGTGGTASIVYDNYYHAGQSPIETVASTPQVIAASIMYVAERGGAGVRGYGFSRDEDQDQPVDTYFQPSDGTIQAGANPIYSNGDPGTLARWQAMSNAYNLINDIQQYLLQPKLNSPDYGPYMVTSARTSSYGKMLMMTNFTEQPNFVQNVDLSEYNPSGGTGTMYQMTGTSLTQSAISGTSTQITFAPGETVVFTFPPSADTTPPVISAATVSGLTPSSATVSWTTNEQANSEVDYGTTSGYGQIVASSSLSLSHSVTLTGLSANTVFHYRIVTEDASGNVADSADATFTTPSALAATSASGTWYNATWSYRKQLTINHTQVSRINGTSLSNFPVLVSLTDPDLRSTANGGKVAQNNGNDILFTASDNATKLNDEIESYNPATGQLIAWVSVPSLSPSVDTIIYLYFGNPSAVNQSNKTGVWDSNYVAVYHLADDTATTTVMDSTNNYNATGFRTDNLVSTSTPIGSGFSYNGTSDYDSSGARLSKSFTLESWFYASPGALTGPNKDIIDFFDGTNEDSWWTGSNEISIINGADPEQDPSLSAGSWYDIVQVRQGDNSTNGDQVYVNGVLVKRANSGSWTVPNAGMRLGFQDNGHFLGSLGEVRISNIARSADWISTEYNNESSPGTFVALGSLAMYSGGTTSTPDTIPPTASISSPLANSTLSGTTSLITVAASDNVGVTQVQLYVDGSLAGTDISAPYTFSLNTTAFNNGPHTLSAKAYDAAGNIGTAPSVPVTIANAGASTSTPSFAITSVSINTITQTSAQMNVTMTKAASVVIKYGPSILYPLATLASPNLASTFFNLQNLSPGILYDFEVTAIPEGSTTALTSQNYTFTTLSASAPSIPSTGSGGGGAVTPLSPVATNTQPSATGSSAHSSNNTGSGAGSSLSASSSLSAIFPRTLTYGDTGPDVTLLQTVLKNLGFFNATTTITQTFGVLTEHAVLLFQNAHLLDKTGAVDAPTQTLLDKVVAANPSLGGPALKAALGSRPGAPSTPVTAPTTPASGSSSFTKNLAPGSSGAEVTLLQQTLFQDGDYPQDLVTGYYGSLTEAAVKVFQAKYGIIDYGSPATTGYGAVGPKTRGELDGV